METKENKSELAKAVAIVNKAIQNETIRLTEIANTEEGDPILVEGETSTGYQCQLMVDPQGCARIALQYDFPTYKILEEDFPEDMWKAFSQEYGLGAVSSVDL